MQARSYTLKNGSFVNFTFKEVEGEKKYEAVASFTLFANGFEGDKGVLNQSDTEDNLISKTIEQLEARIKEHYRN